MVVIPCCPRVNTKTAAKCWSPGPKQYNVYIIYYRWSEMCIFPLGIPPLWHRSRCHFPFSRGTSLARAQCWPILCRRHPKNEHIHQPYRVSTKFNSWETKKISRCMIPAKFTHPSKPRGVPNQWANRACRHSTLSHVQKKNLVISRDGNG